MWINKPKKASHKYNNTEKRRCRAKYYASSNWRKLRDGYLLQHPLCELCEKEGKITAAEDIHHILSPFDQKDIEYHMYNPNNLIALCKKCHGEIHAQHKEDSLYNILYKRDENYIIL